MEKGYVTRNYLWIFEIPPIIERGGWADVNIEISNNHNSTFGVIIQNSSQMFECNTTWDVLECMKGIFDVYTIRYFNKTFRVREDWFVNIKNRRKSESAEYTIRWTFINASEENHKTWKLWTTDFGGCLYDPINGSTCNLDDFRDCYHENMEVCKKRCCRLHYVSGDGREITWYQKCYTGKYLKKTFDIEAYWYANINHDYYTWSQTEFNDENCQNSIGLRYEKYKN